MPSDPGDPVSLLQDRGINESNRLNPRALVDVLKSFNDFKKNRSYNIRLNYARQLVMVTKLLDDTILSPDPLGDVHLATQGDLKHAMDNIKASISTQPHCALSHLMQVLLGPNQNVLPSYL